MQAASPPQITNRATSVVGEPLTYDVYPLPGVDNTANLLLAMNSIGGVLRLAPGEYRFTRPLGPIPDHVQLVGVNAYVGACQRLGTGLWPYGLGGTDIPVPVSGTRFVLTEDVGAGFGDTGVDDGDPFIELGDMGGVRGISFYYEDQPHDATPVPYPWTVVARNKVGAFVRDVELVNSYKGVWLEWCARTLCENVHGTVFYKGIRCEGGYDLATFIRCEFGVPFLDDYLSPAYAYVRANCTAFEFGRNDNLIWIGCFAFAQAVGLHLYHDPAHDTRLDAQNPPGCWGQFVGGGCDANAIYGLLVEQTQSEPSVFTNFNLTVDQDAVPLQFGASHFGDFQISDSVIYGHPNGRGVVVRGSGTVAISNCTFKAEFLTSTMTTVTGTAVDASTGFTGDLTVVGNRFRNPQPHVNLGSGVVKANVSGNLCRGAAFSITNSIADPAKYHVGGNV